MSMRRVINSIRVTVVLMEALKTELPPPENIAAWVVLANHWPCRLSWILQCLEDEQQRAEIDDAVGTATVVDESKALWEVFSDSRMELHMMREEIEDLLEQDGDPEMFEMFLKVHFQFRVRDAERFKLTTVNLDHSIRRELALIRGTTGLKNSGWGRNLAPLNIRTVINMTSEDVCKALARMNLPKKYADIVRSNDLTGQALVFGDPDDLKQLLQMTFGEWTTFRLHFLGIGGRAQSGAKATSLNPKQLTNQQSKQPHFGPHSHGSTLNLSFS
ncbi:NTPase KAP family P-loop domain-containing protein 1-like isoform X1 [Oncorhynchus keta]|uniref:NTPase KAP family P-loop domain-containing protein 1-like isoform X1 n=1 Tax=Oncorhynchus keta TaxID=8018 RepID=UPI00227C2C51|nr:NTPase KAP family P-loop domain-containing protein 1-like isoform X1 [Oncorhynchus keta]XP_052370228.1 NTPase KAP family P-loop domain-containing protein 1-like isoform X1 [Oncorhynchus keta]XP_052370229.1 NTPase KAP family P-loop domain-containing protein 1-like isoform X1 [Oncorhynchus keta]XP_052370230.1 NTPase KAP family P-loop domain-containing protein 1-like isoform X1 [Oncorhynchus keta]XP_052370231.1 NTPase KAP family P-loop domain-containing protein 1-like isoform X1 [Oncorhynchus k